MRAMSSPSVGWALPAPRGGVAEADGVGDGVAAQDDGQELVVGASVGVVEQAVRETSASALMRAADITLYTAKAEGRGRYMPYTPALGARSRRRSEGRSAQRRKLRLIS